MPKVLLIDYLEKNKIPYIFKEAKSYDKSGSRINVPKDWEGRVIVIRDTFNPQRVLSGLTIELSELLANCEDMRKIAKDTKVPCSKIDDEIWNATKRDNDVCRRCAFGKGITDLIDKIEGLYDDNSDMKRKLSKEFYEQMGD